MVFSWGDSTQGQLGLPANEGKWISTPTAVNINEEIVSVWCGEQHTLLLTVNGQVLSCGRNSKGQLGRAKTRDNNKLPVKIEGLGGVAAVACGQDHCLALCDSGQVFSWGANGEGQLGINNSVAKCPKPVPVQIPMPFSIPVVQVACGNCHSLALTKGGEVFSWGQNNYGQLGLGKSVVLQPAPALVRALTGVPVIQISAGGAHTLALALPSRVFCCGANSAGQLGVNRTDEKGRFTICAVPALRNIGVTSISCGEAHSAVLTKTGDVYTFGEGAHGQLGQNSINNELRPKKVEGIDGPAEQVTCGSHHTLILMESGQIFAFGRKVEARESGGTVDSLQPMRVEGDWNCRGAKNNPVMKISSGWNSNFLYFPPSKTSVLGDPVGKLDEAQVQKWVSISENDRNIKEVQREILLTFSTSSNLVACFMKDSGTISKDTVEVDLNAASQTFDQLLTIPWIKCSVNIKPLVMNLLFSAPVMRCPEIFMLLPTCPILHETENFNRVLELAVAITSLHDTAIEIMKNFWSSMEASMMKKHIRMWKRALVFLLNANLTLQFNPGVKAVLEVLKYIYKGNKRAEKSRRVPLSDFYIEEIGLVPQLLEQDVALWAQIKYKEVQEVDATPAIFCRYPFLLDLNSKIHIFRFVAFATQFIHQILSISTFLGQMFQNEFSVEPSAPMFQLKLKRTALLEDTFRHLDNADHNNFKKRLVVIFVEDSKLTEVNKRDFFLHAFNELLAPDSKMFMNNERQTMIWFPANATFEHTRYFLFGILCGLALYNNNIVYMPFPLAMFKKLVNVKPTLEDLAEFSPEIGRSLRCILHEYPDDVVNDLNTTFCIHWDGADVELDPLNSGKPVTSANKKDFVDAYVDYVLNKSVEKVFEEFRRGFFKVCDPDVVDFFQPEELRGVTVGTEEYDWETFKKNTMYGGQFHERHSTIIAFWEVFEELTEEQKKSFLLFLTGCDRVPILGMGEIRMNVLDLCHFTQNHLPESQTCHFNFMLPPYENKQRLMDKLIEALKHNRGFWKE
ncbi:probable E3 ubiquitin-protein ligase HERC6 [Trichomycterus rosablanca]|uniref:probable E3 ubiquitin-protein ligase HERC6 n=1 Tax=Trichomycterus rosablanca TaxID=2290929 RepID=UPI002F359C52